MGVNFGMLGSSHRHWWRPGWPLRMWEAFGGTCKSKEYFNPYCTDYSCSGRFSWTHRWYRRVAKTTKTRSKKEAVWIDFLTPCDKDLKELTKELFAPATKGAGINLPRFGTTAANKKGKKTKEKRDDHKLFLKPKFIVRFFSLSFEARANIYMCACYTAEDARQEGQNKWEQRWRSRRWDIVVPSKKKVKENDLILSLRRIRKAHRYLAELKSRSNGSIAIENGNGHVTGGHCWGAILAIRIPISCAFPWNKLCYNDVFIKFIV